LLVAQLRTEIRLNLQFTAGEFADVRRYVVEPFPPWVFSGAAVAMRSSDACTVVDANRTAAEAVINCLSRI